MRHKDGSYRWIRSRAFILRDATGRIYRKAGSHEDITERRNAEEELRKSRERFELAVLASQDGMSDWDIQANTVWYSPQWKKMLGYEDHEIPNRPGEWRNLLHPDDYDRAVASLYGRIDGPDSHWVSEERLRHKDGSYRWVRAHVVALRDANGRAYRAVGSHEDITERKQAEEALAQERYLLHTLMDNLPDGIYFKDAASRFLRANNAVLDLLGLDDPAQIVGKTDFDFFTEEYAHSTRADEQEIIRSGRPLVGDEKKVTWLDGRERWVSTTKMPFRDRDGTIIGTFGVTRDISERKQAEMALRDSEDRYRSVIAAMQDGILILDAEAGILACNAAAERILGLSADQMRGRMPQDPRWRAIHEDGSPFPGDTFPSMVTLRTGQPCFDVIMGVHKPTGELTWISINSQPLFRPGEDRPHAVVASFEDITSRKRTEEALRETAAELARCRQELERLRTEGSGREREALR
jgi:PAS domain S-box-containing protein